MLRKTFFSEAFFVLIIFLYCTKFPVMKRYKLIFSLFVLVLFVSCKSATTASKKDALKNNYLKGNSIALEDVSDSTFINVLSAGKDFVIDMKYASSDNFLKQKVYDCDDCYLRYKTIKRLVEANKEFMKDGYRIKIFDCYRPLDIQKKMWEIVPNADYVANPKKGSVHNRGGAVDITLVDASGKEVDMGTPFDFFGEAASHNYQNLPEEVLKNRAYLKGIMLKHTFKSFDSEWWHYNLTTGLHDKIANFKWDCD